jgi:hypothetical protein
MIRGFTVLFASLLTADSTHAPSVVQTVESCDTNLDARILLHDDRKDKHLLSLLLEAGFNRFKTLGVFIFALHFSKGISFLLHALHMFLVH